ncbi:cytochrome P450 [Lentinula raphanica]|nr:cytochrome P450 [Lentinula raphanica]
MLTQKLECPNTIAGGFPKQVRHDIYLQAPTLSVGKKCRIQNGLRDRYVSPTDSFRTNFSIAWMEYLEIFTLPALLLDTRLVVSDPSTLKFFFQNPYKFFQPPLDALSSNLINGAGAVFSEIGLLRGIMDPAFRKHVGTFKKGIDTGNSLSWASYELASNFPVWQERVRDEIVDLQDRNRFEDTEDVFPSAKLDSFAYLNAHIKPRQEEIEQIFVETGTSIHFNLAAYNKMRSIWGKDAGSFNPSRWFTKESPETEKESGDIIIPVGLGPYANLSSFIGEARVCVDWRFSISLMQTFLVRCLTKFRFRLLEDVEIRPVSRHAHDISYHLARGG